jgi:hypothetical protein
MSAVMPAPRKDFFVHSGAPDPIVFRRRVGGAAGALLSFDSTLRFQYVTPSSAIVLSVGNGITLAADEAVANARAIVQMTVAQSRAIPAGTVTRYEVQRVTAGREEVILMGRLIGYGGDNPDG